MQIEHLYSLANRRTQYYSEHLTTFFLRKAKQWATEVLLLSSSLIEQQRRLVATYRYANIVGLNRDYNWSVHCIPCRCRSSEWYNRPLDRNKWARTMDFCVHRRWDCGREWIHYLHRKVWRMFYSRGEWVDSADWLYNHWLFRHECVRLNNGVERERKRSMFEC